MDKSVCKMTGYRPHDWGTPVGAGIFLFATEILFSPSELHM
jgi:hypothetical protein